ncbi:MAG TPA: glycosyltransferase family 39 protein [Anaerolineae bacterium]|nr:glycosyltransferase family 39 protein [Anaerolineae bacterium]HQH38419.1 glycosyltransferase family 39 protein [Anaerolineae bacterium]
MKHSTRSRGWTERALLLLLLLVGAGLRLWDVGRTPPGLYHDEAQNGLDALTVLETGRVPLYFPANNGREPLFIYLVTLSVAVLGRSPLAVRLPAFFVGFLTLAATYDLARVLWGRRAGTYALAVLSVTFWHVHLSRSGFRAVMLPLLTALFLAQAVRALRTGKTRHWIAAGALYGASWYTYIAARFTPVALGVMLLYGWLFHRRRTLRAWRGALLFCGVAWLVLAPLGVYTWRYPEVVLARTGQVTILSDEINGGDFWGTLLEHTWRTAGMFVVRGDRIWRHNLAWRPVWEPALGLAFVIGVGVALAEFRRHAGAALALLWTAVMALPTLLAEDAPHFLRAVGVLPTAVLFPTLGLLWIESKVASANHASRITRRLPSTIYRLLPAFLCFIAFLSTTGDYFVRYAGAPLTYHWFEAGPVAMAGEVNAFLGAGWDGRRMLHTPRANREVYVDRQLWESWTAVPFLTPSDAVHFLPLSTPVAVGDGLLCVVWPYRDWEPDVLPYLPHPAYLSVAEGPPAQGDLDSTPFTVALFVRAAPRPEVPSPVARFDKGILLRAALVQSEDDGVRIRLWWDAESAVAEPYTVFVHYLRDGVRIAQHDAPPGNHHLPTTLWQPGDLILDEHPLSGIAPDPAHDSLRIGFYHSVTGEGLSRLDDAGNPAGDWVDVGVVLAP